MKSAGYWLGIDLGTSGVKALLMNAGQETVASTQAELEVSRPKTWLVRTGSWPLVGGDQDGS